MNMQGSAQYDLWEILQMWRTNWIGEQNDGDLFMDWSMEYLSLDISSGF
jgi:hypothetical protein